jgi:DNA invertase Pin-like site-specific DNA recombinase
MVSTKYKKLEKFRTQLAKLEKEMGQINAKLCALPAKFGFKTMDAFITALRSAAGSAASAKGSSSVAASGRKRRAKVTPEIKQKVKSLVNGGKTGSEIAKALDISLPTVQNIKSELGLVKKRK